MVQWLRHNPVAVGTRVQFPAGALRISLTPVKVVFKRPLFIGYMDIHNYKKRLEDSKERIKNSDEISKNNKKLIFDFIDDMLADGIGPAKISRYVTDILRLNRMLKKDFDKANKKDIKSLIAKLNNTDLSEETKRSFKIMIRKFYKFIRGVKGKGNYPEEVDWFTVSLSNGKKKLPEELLNEKEMENIIQSCLNERDRALISILCESGARIGEIMNLKIKHISFEQHGARLMLRGKTGMRRILVIGSCPYLQRWLNHHPDNKNREAFLWIKNNKEILSYTRVNNILKNSAKRAEIQKKVHPHLLRHSRATIMASIMKEAGMKQYFGWTQNSKMAGVYVHMNGQETDNAILEAHGIKKEEKTKPIMDNKICLRCSAKNGATYRVCHQCGLPLDKEEAKKVIEKESEREKADEIMNELMQDSEIKELIKKKLS